MRSASCLCFTEPEALRALFRPHVGRGALLPPLHHCQSPCRLGRSRVRLQGLSDCSAGPALARVFPWVPWSLVPVGILHGLGWHLPLWGTFSATPSCSSKRASQGEFQSGAKGRAPLPPLIPAKAGGLGALRLRLPWPAVWSCTSDGVHSPGQSQADSWSRVLRTQVIPETPRSPPLPGFATGPTHPRSAASSLGWDLVTCHAGSCQPLARHMWPPRPLLTEPDGRSSSAACPVADHSRSAIQGISFITKALCPRVSI